MPNFWKNLESPILALAPMEDVTDTVFRQIVQAAGKPSAMFTEFTNCEGVQSVGQAKVIHRLKYSDTERPIVAQVWGITPEDYYKTAVLIREMGFDGIDINMGCPVKNVIKMGACSALIKNPSLAKEIVEATKQGAGQMPVSIKTRIGFSEIQTEEWCGFLLRECRPAALTVHGRTVKEESKVPCHWDEIGKVAKLRNQIHYPNKTDSPVILGNGDIKSLADASEKIAESGLDGVMVGRAIFHNPWFFNPNIQLNELGELVHLDTGFLVSKTERLELLIKHAQLWSETWGATKNFNVLKKYFKIYIQGFNGASQLRAELMETKSVDELLVSVFACIRA